MYTQYYKLYYYDAYFTIISNVWHDLSIIRTPIIIILTYLFLKRIYFHFSHSKNTYSRWNVRDTFITSYFSHVNWHGHKIYWVSQETFWIWACTFIALNYVWRHPFYGAFKIFFPTYTCCFGITSFFFCLCNVHLLLFFRILLFRISFYGLRKNQT